MMFVYESVLLDNEVVGNKETSVKVRSQGRNIMHVYGFVFLASSVTPNSDVTRKLLRIVVYSPVLSVDAIRSILKVSVLMPDVICLVRWEGLKTCSCAILCN